MVLAAIDIRHAVQDPNRPYDKWTDPNNPSEAGARIFSDEKTRQVMEAQVPHLPSEVFDSIMQFGDAVLKTPVLEVAAA